MIHPKSIIFDLDGTLIHSAPDLQSAANAALGALGRQTLDLPTVISFIGNGVETLMERCLNATGGHDASLQHAAMDLFMENYKRNMTTLTRPYPGVLSALQGFRNAGISLGICTNKPSGPAQEICNQLDLSQFFHVITGAEAGQPKKPDPAPLLKSISALGVSSADVLYVGDSAIDFLTAQNASVSFRLFAKGYLNDPLPNLPDTDRFSHWGFHGIPIDYRQVRY